MNSTEAWRSPSSNISVTVLLLSALRFSQRSVGFTNRRPSTLENSNVLTGMDVPLRRGRRYLKVRGSADFSLGRRSEVAMVLWIGVDDTDSLSGMCTTFLATEIVRDLTQDLDLIGYPRLVRLNPNIPWKTRGNGAVCIRVGNGSGPTSIVGSIAGRFIVSYRRGRTPQGMEAVAKRAGRA